MKNWEIIRERYLRDALPIRLGGLAANLSRIKSFASHNANEAVVGSLIEESKYFIEWTASEAELSHAAELVELQIQLAVWERRWSQIWDNLTKRQQIATAAAAWSQRVLAMSGLLS